MKNKISYLPTLLLAGILVFTVHTSQAQETQLAHLGFHYPISTQGTFSPQYTNHFSFHVLSGVSGGEKGFAFYGLAGIVKGDVEGVQIAGLVNLVEGELHGVQFSGLLNKARLSKGGSQISGLTNLSRGVSTMQISGLTNKTDEIKALQVAGLVNIAKQSSGPQIAGLTNHAQHVKGTQLAGLVNTADVVEGAQISGLINRARVVKGVQLAGLINIADSSDYPIGIVNLVKNGTKRMGVSTDENLSTLLSFRSGGNKLYGLIGLGTNLQYSTLAYGFEAGLGLILHKRDNFQVDLEAFNLFMTDFQGSEYSKSGIRLLPALNLGRNIQLYGGPSLNFMHTEKNGEYRSGSWEIWGKSYKKGYSSLDLGYTVGVQLRLP